ncbi:CbtA family protein [Methylobrevis pamukkalensis]|uniref:Putative cobalt transporter subunit (CbtA) n=1 Tax=Methylobrevis pamukkalensis TaxID=1439726 RepID=A0A1E3H0M4_9HYPH|nr:CbtA family protein [Methylobrevis pamukkalensis]ODN69850.1 putative cobalt transporter subunit (CbtA) [Methylobrevis pamukkalensis]
MLNRILAVGLLAGLVAGSAVAVLQEVTTSRLIIAAEAFEGAGEAPAAAAPAAHDHAGHDHPDMAASGHDHAAPAAALADAGTDDHAASGHQHDSDAWMPADGLERTLVTSLATIATSIGFALMLTAVMVAADGKVTTRSALGWGLSAFIAVNLAPAIGLAPELPGASAAALEARQLWWFGTVAATAAGLFLLGRRPEIVAKSAGLALIVAPHVIGAPHPNEFESAVPAEIAAQFASVSLGLAAAMWLLIAAAAGWFWQRGDAREGLPA